MVIASLGVERGFAKGQWTLTHTDGQTSNLKLPVGITSRPAAAKATLSLEKAGDIALAFDPPCGLAFDKDLRVLLAQDVFKAGSRAVTLTVALPDDAAFLARQEDLDRLTRTLAGPDWFAFAPTDDLGPSVIGMDDWLEKPAGKRGGVRMAGDRFQFADGTPVKFWGVNLSYGGGCAPEKKAAEFTAARYAKYGVNGVRLHKFSYPTDQMGIGDRNDSTRMTPEGLDRLDYFAAQLKERGVYYGWSHTFGFQVRPANRQPAAGLRRDREEPQGQHLRLHQLRRGRAGPDDRDGRQPAEAQEPVHRPDLRRGARAVLHRAAERGRHLLLHHRTGLQGLPDLREALQPSASATGSRRSTARRRSLKKAWGDALKADETLAAGNIVPQTNPWFFGDGQPARRRRAARASGCSTPPHFCTSCRTSSTAGSSRPSATPATRARSAARPGRRRPCCRTTTTCAPTTWSATSTATIISAGGLFDTMLTQPGSGYFCSGLQQVADRPFGLCEWIHVYPSLYSAEGPAIIAAYGMGLQGWDASYEFQSQIDRRTFNDRVGWPPWGVWEADVPTQLGQYPVLARMIYRGDVQESDVISTRRVSQDALGNGQFNFSDKVQQQGDVKTFGGSGAGRGPGRRAGSWSSSPSNRRPARSRTWRSTGRARPGQRHRAARLGRLPAKGSSP